MLDAFIQLRECFPHLVRQCRSVIVVTPKLRAFANAVLGDIPLDVVVPSIDFERHPWPILFAEEYLGDGRYGQPFWRFDSPEHLLANNLKFYANVGRAKAPYLEFGSTITEQIKRFSEDELVDLRSITILDKDVVLPILFAIEVAPADWISRQEVTLKATFKRGKVIPGDVYSVLDLIPNYSVANGEVTVEDAHGVRYHFTRPHWWPKDPNDPRRRYVKHYWSGNPELGVVTPIYAG